MEKGKRLRVYVDTNIFISLLAFNSIRMRYFLNVVQTKHQLVLSTAVLDEINEVLTRRFPTALPLVDEIFQHLSYELITTPEPTDPKYHRVVDQLPRIKDPDDVIIFVGAWLGNADIIVSHDKKHFHTKEVKRVFTVMTVDQFLQNYKS